MRLIWLSVRLYFTLPCMHFSDIYCQCGLDKRKALQAEIQLMLMP